MTTRSELEASLSVYDSQALKLILDASGVDARGSSTPSELAARIVDAMWWSYSTPLGYVADQASFEDIVWHVARKLRVADRVDRKADAYDQSQQLTQALFGDLPDEAVGVAQLDSDTQRRLGASWLPTVMLGGSAGSSFVARWGSGKFLNLLKTPVGRLLPLLPAVGPYIGAIKTATGAVHMVAGPLGIALSVLTFNQALGANYRRLVPLVLSVGALRPRSVDDAQIIDFPGASDDENTPPADQGMEADDIVEAADVHQGSDDVHDADEDVHDADEDVHDADEDVHAGLDDVQEDEDDAQDEPLALTLVAPEADGSAEEALSEDVLTEGEDVAADDDDDA